MRGKIELVEEEYLKKRISKFSPGDTVQIHVKLKEQDKERVQIFEGIVIGVRGTGLGRMVTVRKVVQGEGVERIFPVHSPKIAKISVMKRGRVRRAKLYYLREREGRKARIEEIFVTADKEQQLAETEAIKEKKEEKKIESPKEAKPAEATKKKEEKKVEPPKEAKPAQVEQAQKPETT